MQVVRMRHVRIRRENDVEDFGVANRADDCAQLERVGGGDRRLRARAAWWRPDGAHPITANLQAGAVSSYETSDIDSQSQLVLTGFSIRSFGARAIHAEVVHVSDLVRCQYFRKVIDGQ